MAENVRPNLASLAKLQAVNASSTLDGFKWHIVKTGGTDGLIFNTNELTVGETYTLSFKYQKTSGTLQVIGGHCEAFSQIKFTIDGIEQTDTYIQGAPVADDSEVHEVVYTGVFNGNSSNKNLYFQPNRKKSTAVSCYVWDIKMEVGDTATAWIPATEDVVSNTYNTLGELFTAIANAIRAKKQTTVTIVADDFPAEIEGIETGGNTSELEAQIAELEAWKQENVGYADAMRTRVDTEGCSYMFYKCSHLTTVPLFDTSKVALMQYMFSGCSSLTTIPLFDTSNVANTSYMFNGCSSLTTVPLFDTSEVTSMSNMFYKCSSLTTVPLFDTGKVTSMYYMFEGCSSLTTVPLFDTSNVTNMSYMFSGCSSLTPVPQFDTSNVTNMSYMLYACSSLTTVPLFDTSNVTNMSYMFGSCARLTTVPQFDTSNVTNMSNMFRNCSYLTTVPLFDIRNVTSVSGMFSGCYYLTDCYLRNIKVTLQVGSGVSYGHLLTLDSLIHLVKELRDTGSRKTLTVGSANLEKLANVYVRTIDITDEMRAEDDLIDEKLPFEVCESTDEGAMLITNYVVEKNWQLA